MTAGWTRPGLTLETSILVSTRPFLYSENPPFYMVKTCLPYVVKTGESLDVILDDSANLCKWILMNG